MNVSQALSDIGDNIALAFDHGVTPDHIITDIENIKIVDDKIVAFTSVHRHAPEDELGMSITELQRSLQKLDKSADLYANNGFSGVQPVSHLVVSLPENMLHTIINN